MTRNGEMVEREGERKRLREREGEGEKDRQTDKQEKQQMCMLEHHANGYCYYYTAVCAFKRQYCELPQGVDAFYHKEASTTA